MSRCIVFAPSFRHSLKKLAKRFPHVKDDVGAQIRALQQDPMQGSIIRGGSGIRKVRVRNSDLPKGKSGGYRLLYYIEGYPVSTIYILFLYAKSDRDSVTIHELRQLLKEIIVEEGS